MHTIKYLQGLVLEALKKQDYPLTPKELYQPVSYFMNLGGKRLRPVLLLMANDLFGGNIHEALKPALAMEIFHNFTLLHDDIMDKAPLRRGHVTVHKKWNEPIAILAGDVMLIKAYQFLNSVTSEELKTVLDIFNETAIGVCEGQQIDMNFETRDTVTIAEYLEMIRLKTAVLLGGSLKIGAVLAKASAADAEKIYEFGVNLGIAFQLQDDILDAFGDPDKFGKQTGGDIITKKKTYLLIRAFELADERQKQLLKDTLNSDQLSEDVKIKQVINLYNLLNIKEKAIGAMNNYIEKAIIALEQIQLEPSRKIILKEFVDLLQTRET